ncbi:unnamed protein product [Dicrocoelium dendriticum]|nr:unnamed protein product [Dicrocoelium dendriticum]
MTIPITYQTSLNMIFNLRHRFASARNKARQPVQTKSPPEIEEASAKEKSQSVHTEWRVLMTNLADSRAHIYKLRVKSNEIRGKYDRPKCKIARSSEEAYGVDFLLGIELCSLELLFSLADHLRYLERELEKYCKMVRRQICKNRAMKRKVLRRHEEWLSKAEECQQLEKEYSAWQYALTLEDATFSVLYKLEDCTLIDAKHWVRVEPDTRTKLNVLPWIWLPEGKCGFQCRVVEKWHRKEYQDAVLVTLDVLSTQQIRPATQQHRSRRSSVVEITKAVGFCAELSSRCHQANQESLSLNCADHSVNLLTFLTPSKLSKSAEPVEEDDRYVQITKALSTADIQETDWALVMEATRKLVSVLWGLGKQVDALALLLSVLNARKNSLTTLNRTASASGYSLFGCLLTGALMMFAGQVTLSTCHLKNYQDHVSLGLLELGMIYSEGALASSILESLSLNEKTREIFRTTQIQSTFLQWALHIEGLVRLCASMGATFDVLLLAWKLLKVMAFIKPMQDESAMLIDRLLLMAFHAEEEEYRREFWLENDRDSRIDQYVKGLTFVQTSGSVESILNEVVLVCRGQRWDTAAAFIHWWITGCYMMRRALSVRQKRSRQNPTFRVPFAKFEHIVDITTAPSARRNVTVNFLYFLACASTRNGTVDNADEAQHSSCLRIDPRMIALFPAFKMAVIEFTAVIQRLCVEYDTHDMFSENYLQLHSNRKLLSWWQHGATDQRGSDATTWRPDEVFINKQELIHLQDETIGHVGRHFHSVLLTSGTKADSQLSSVFTINKPRRACAHLQFTPYPVVDSLTPMVFT